jgi:hypothetical protein
MSRADLKVEDHRRGLRIAACLSKVRSESQTHRNMTAPFPEQDTNSVRARLIIQAEAQHDSYNRGYKTSSQGSMLCARTKNKDPLHIKERREISTVQITSGRLSFDD